MNKAQFIKYVKDHCKEHGFKVVITRYKYIYDKGDKSRYSGYFDDEGKILKVAGLNPNFYGVLAHEYCHFTQHLDMCKAWEKALAEKSYYHFGDFLNGKEIDDVHIDNVRDVEEDNERRTVRLIKALNLPIDIDDYTKKANAYIYFYNWLKITRRWSRPDNSAYTNQRLYEAMPSVFQKDYSKLPKKYEKIFREENI